MGPDTLWPFARHANYEGKQCKVPLSAGRVSGLLCRLFFIGSYCDYICLLKVGYFTGLFFIWLLKVTCFTCGSFSWLLKVTCFTGSSSTFFRISCFTGGLFTCWVRVVCFLGDSFACLRRTISITGDWFLHLLCWRGPAIDQPCR